MPADGYLDRREWLVATIPSHLEALGFLRREHYARGGSLTAVARHGLYRSELWPFRGDLHGVALWLPPTRTAAEAAVSVTIGFLGLRARIPLADWRGVLALSRLAVAAEVPRNGASYLLGRSMAFIDRQRWPVLLTYADSRLGHTGAIYRATNWTDLGEVPAGDTWIDSEGRQRGRKRGGRTITRTEMRAAGLVQTAPAPKRKFVHVAV